MEYSEMLERAYSSLPEKTLTRERFEVPRLESFIQGNKTIVKNLGSVLKLIKRDEKHVLKFLAKETATSANMEEGRLILNGKFSEQQVNDLFNNYMNNYVLCRECKKPDTHFTEKQGVKMLKCEACGAVSPTKGL